MSPQRFQRTPPLALHRFPPCSAIQRSTVRSLTWRNSATSRFVRMSPPLIGIPSPRERLLPANFRSCATRRFLIELESDGQELQGVGARQAVAFPPLSWHRTVYQTGFNVTLWPKSSRLFHPKILIALFRDEVVWSDGSLNLTPAGWRRNREIAMLHRPRRLALPQELRELIGTFPGVAAARRILEETTKQGPAELPGQYLTNLHAPIGTRFISAAPKQVEEVHLVAPFFEREDSNEAPLDDRWLHVLAQRYPHADFHIYLPQLEAERLRVQGCRELFDSLEQQISNPIVLHPVAAAPGALHGKIVCLVYIPKRIRRAKLLVGSPNMTHAALVARPSYGNIESAWIVTKGGRMRNASFTASVPSLGQLAKPNSCRHK